MARARDSFQRFSQVCFSPSSPPEFLPVLSLIPEAFKLLFDILVV